MIIKKRSGSKNYHCDIWTGTERIRQSLHTNEYSLALARAHELVRNAKARSGRPAGGVPLADFAKKYMEWAWETKPSSAKTEAYRSEITLQWFKGQGVVRLEDVTPYHVELFRAWIREKDRRRKPDENGNQGVSSKATANRYCALLRTMFNRAADWQLYDGPNPVKRVRLYRESPEVRGYSDKAVVKIMEAAKAISDKPDPDSPIQKCWHDMVALVLNTGLRRSELLNIRWRDIQGGELHVIGKGSKRRVVPLNEIARGVLIRQARKGEFLWDLPNRMQSGILRHTFRHMRRLIGEDFKLHRLRHTFATSLLASGVDVVTISNLLGHGKVMTSLLYSHSSPERKAQAVASLCHVSVSQDNGLQASQGKEPPSK